MSGGGWTGQSAGGRQRTSRCCSPLSTSEPFFWQVWVGGRCWDPLCHRDRHGPSRLCRCWGADVTHLHSTPTAAREPGLGSVRLWLFARRGNVLRGRFSASTDASLVFPESRSVSVVFRRSSLRCPDCPCTMWPRTKASGKRAPGPCPPPRPGAAGGSQREPPPAFSSWVFGVRPGRLWVAAGCPGRRTGEPGAHSGESRRSVTDGGEVPFGLGDQISRRVRSQIIAHLSARSARQSGEASLRTS